MTTRANAPTPPSLATRAWYGLVLLTVVLILTALYHIFYVAPVELQMGVVQKIFYFHVPSAYAMYVGFVTCGIASGVYLKNRSGAWDAIAVGGAEVGVLFCAIVLVTGPLWARKAWGVWWTWDPRLTSTMLAGMIYLAFMSLRGSGGAGEVEKRFAAGLALVGLPVVAIIHKSVERWRGQHPTVIRAEGGGMDPAMYPALMYSFAAFTALVILLIWTRARIERARQEVAGLELEAAQRGLLEDT